jgi:class 3 adenylate cyclase
MEHDRDRLGVPVSDQTSREQPSHALQAYVPPYVRWRLAREPDALPGPFQEIYCAAVIHTDITGFTSLAEQLAVDGNTGAEHVRDTLGLFFKELGAIVDAHEGYTLSFGGDSATAMWPVRDIATLPDAVRRALRCATALHSALNGKQFRHAGRLGIHLSVGAGEVRAGAVGGIEGQWFPTVYGNALDQASRAQSRAQVGQILASPEAWQLIPEDVRGERVEDGTLLVNDVRMTTLAPADRIAPDTLSPPEQVRAYVPRSVLAQHDEGTLEWMAEFRHATVAFIHIRNLPHLSASDSNALQRFVAPVQASVSATGGSINKVFADHDGMTVVAAWGLPRHAYEDNAVRAVQAVISAERRLQSLGVDASIGVASGRTYMGQAGTDHYKEFALLGDVVNVAARLAHEVEPGIRCDGATRIEARPRLVFEALPPARLRGRQHAVAVYRPLAEKTHRRERDRIIGRQNERRQLGQALDDIETSRRVHVLVIEGEPGIGKSRLVGDLIAQSQYRPVQSLVGWGEALERATPYHAWRDIFARLLRLDAVGDRESQRARVLTELETPERRSKVALTNVVLPFDFPETADTQALRPAARARATREMLVYLFDRLTRTLPTVVVLEDAHWLDSASWALAHDLSALDARLLIAIVSRPVLAEEMSPDWRSLRDAETTTRLRLEAMSADDAIALACHRLDVDALPPEIADRVIRIAEGHPFFTEQLVLAMRDKDRVIRVEAGECHVVNPVSTVTFADTVHALIDSRIDGVSPQHQLTLKVAAVLGRRFDAWSLRATHPGNPDAAELQKQLDMLTDLELLRVTDDSTGRTYSFKHAITQEAVTGCLLPSERKNLNARVAQMLEEQHPADLTPVHALLAHHWREAGVVPKALDYLELAARQALREDANQEALAFIEQALEYARTAPTLDTAMVLRTAVWKRHFAEASWVMGDTLRAKQYVTEAMGDLHHRVRRPGVELAVQIVSRMAQAVLPRALVVQKDPGRRQQLVEASRVAAISAILHTDPLENVPALASGLLSYNLGERAGTTNVYALAMLAYGAGMLKLRGTAHTYFARMREEAHAQSEMRPLLFGILLESMHLFSSGDLEASERCLKDGLTLAGGGGNQRDRARLLLLLGATTCYSGHMTTGLRAVEEAYDLARYEKQAALERSWSLITLAGAYAQHLPSERMLEVVGDLQQKIQASLKQDTTAEGVTPNHFRAATAVALDALVHARAGQLERALTSTHEALRFLTSMRDLVAVHPPTWLLIQGPLETFWRAWSEAADRPELARQAAADARQFGTVLSRFALLHPVYRPRALLFRGGLHLSNGRRARARRAWAKGLALANALAQAQHAADDRFFMFDRALLLCALGGGALEARVDRARLEQAEDLFARCEMPCFEGHVRSLLDDKGTVRRGRMS